MHRWVVLASCAWAAAARPAAGMRRLGNASEVAARCAAPHLRPTTATHCERIARSSNGVTVDALARGGWLCRALLVLQSTEASATKKGHQEGDRHEAIDAACGFSPDWRPTPRRDGLVVVAVHHNGLGNQLFQYAFGRLAAWASGAAFVAQPIVATEGPMNVKLPPHSMESWGAFGEIFDARTFGDDRGASRTCAPLTPTKKEYAANGTMLLAERPADTRRVRLAAQLRALLDGTRLPRGTLRCVKTIGYWQRYAFYADVSAMLREWMVFRPLSLTEDPAERDVVVHVRLCKTPYHFYQYLDYPTYFAPILKGMADVRSIKVISACDPKSNGVVKDLVDKANATIATPFVRGAEGRKGRSVAADFAYLARAKRLIVTESTYSWWAAFLGAADVVHAPGSGVVPVPAREPRYVFHDAKARTYWGAYNDTARALVYTA